MLVQVHRLDRYKQKWPKTLVWVHDLDLYKHLKYLGGRRPTEGGGRSPAGESFPPCPWGQPRSGGGERGEASATKQKKPARKAGLFSRLHRKNLEPSGGPQEG